MTARAPCAVGWVGRAWRWVFVAWLVPTQAPLPTVLARRGSWCLQGLAALECVHACCSVLCVVCSSVLTMLRFYVIRIARAACLVHWDCHLHTPACCIFAKETPATAAELACMPVRTGCTQWSTCVPPGADEVHDWGLTCWPHVRAWRKCLVRAALARPNPRECVACTAVTHAAPDDRACITGSSIPVCCAEGLNAAGCRGFPAWCACVCVYVCVSERSM